MGALSSCLGRDNSTEDNTDESRRLLHAPYQGGYGGTNNAASDQADSEAMRREREALDGIYHSLSNNVFDVFSAQAQTESPNKYNNSSDQQHQHMNEQTSTTMTKQREQGEDAFHASQSHARSQRRSQADNMNGGGDGAGDDDLATEEMRLRTIKRPRSGPMFISMQKGNTGMKSAVRAAIG